MNKPLIRPANPDEAAVARCLAKAWQPDLPWLRTGFPQIALCAGEIIGFAWEAKVPGSLLLDVVECVYVLDEYRGAKLGLRLVDQVFMHSSAPAMYLDCCPSLAAYYRQVGFELIDRALVTPDYMGDADPPENVAMVRYRHVS